MAIRVSKLLREANIDISTLDEILKALNCEEPLLSFNSKLSDEIASHVLSLCYKDVEFLDIIKATTSKTVFAACNNINPDLFNNKVETVEYKELNKNFRIDELILLSPSGDVNCIGLSPLQASGSYPLYSVLIGNNGVGKSSIMREIVDFYVDLYYCIHDAGTKYTPFNDRRLKGIKYSIDGSLCEVIRLNSSFLAKIDGNIRPLRSLRLPSIVACHFGAFEKFPVQKVSGSTLTRYDIPYYKYVGAHVNGSMISSSAIAFRLLFALNERMNERQRENVRSILNFIGYDQKISLQYSFVMKSRKEGNVRAIIVQGVSKDREYANCSVSQKNNVVSQLYGFYKKKTSIGKAQHFYEIEFDDSFESSDTELKFIYKLKQYDLISSTSVLFYKHGSVISSEDMSSGEFAMLSTVLSISAAASDSHTLVLLDEPELSQHPNWQMTLIDNIDRALRNNICHLLIATHSHMLVSDLPMNRSCVTQLEKNQDGNIIATPIAESTYGWSAEEVLLKVFRTATDRNRYFGERIGKLLEQMGNGCISPNEVVEELTELQEISMHLSDVDPMKMVLNTIVKAYM